MLFWYKYFWKFLYQIYLKSKPTLFKDKKNSIIKNLKSKIPIQSKMFSIDRSVESTLSHISWQDSLPSWQPVCITFLKFMYEKRNQVLFLPFLTCLLLLSWRPFVPPTVRPASSIQSPTTPTPFFYRKIYI